MGEVTFDQDYADIGAMVPRFERVQDGYYTERVVLDEVPVAGWVSNDSCDLPTAPIAHHIEPCRIPRWRHVLRWDWVLSGRSAERGGAALTGSSANGPTPGDADG